jgi:uncharacterized protein (UPF0332 family)
VTQAGRRELCAREVARAEEELRVAAQIIDGGSPRVAMTRIYYAIFHAVRALLYVENLEPRTHHGTFTVFRQRFVQTGEYEVGVSLQISKLQRYREEADYDDTFQIDEPTARAELAAARPLVERLGTDAVKRAAALE